MSDDSNYRITQWQPPKRPEWVQRINEEGNCLDIKGVVPLDPDSLISRATANTGLSDFGDEAWRESFEILVKSFDEESELNLMGRIMTRSDMLMYLEARLHIEDAYKKHPEINDVELAPPIMIIGSGRSGTSALQDLLALDPDNKTPRQWEALFPAPPPEAATYHADPRIELADKRLTQWNRVTPQMATIHDWGGPLPSEITAFEAMSFHSGAWFIFCGFTPSHGGYLANRGGEPGLLYTKRVMKLLQWKNPCKRWLLKAPDSMRNLPDVFKVFPNIQLIWIHRDPLKTLSSVINLLATIVWTRSDKPMAEGVMAQLTNPSGLAGLFGMVMDQIDQGLLPTSQFHHVQYLDFIKDPLATTEKVYKEMGIVMSQEGKQAIATFLREHPREKRPAHRYNVGDEARRAEERKVFERYQNYFQVGNEI
jgi:Sulfotransferase family